MDLVKERHMPRVILFSILAFTLLCSALYAQISPGSSHGPMPIWKGWHITASIRWRRRSR